MPPGKKTARTSMEVPGTSRIFVLRVVVVRFWIGSWAADLACGEGGWDCGRIVCAPCPPVSFWIRAVKRKRSHPKYAIFIFEDDSRISSNLWY